MEISQSRYLTTSGDAGVTNNYKSHHLHGQVKMFAVKNEENKIFVDATTKINQIKIVAK